MLVEEIEFEWIVKRQKSDPVHQANTNLHDLTLDKNKNKNKKTKTKQNKKKKQKTKTKKPAPNIKGVPGLFFLVLFLFLSCSFFFSFF